MYYKNEKAILRPIILVGLILLLSGCNTVELQSEWRKNEISIDGHVTDWEQNSYYIEDEDIVLTLLNDEEYIYIMLNTRETQIVEQILMSGFTIYFDPDNGKDKSFGIKYPVGKKPSEQQETRGMDFDRGSGRTEQDMKMMLGQAGEFIDIVNSSDENTYNSISLEYAAKIGIGVALSETLGVFFYEFKIPLYHNDKHPYAIGVEPDDTSTEPIFIGIGFETGNIDMGATGKPSGSMRGGSGGGAHGGGGMGGRPPGSGMGEGQPGGGERGGIQKAKQLELWTSIELAKKE